MPLTRHNVVIEAHRLCQPVKVRSDGEHVPLTLPDRVAQMYLDMSAEWHLRLAGVGTAPLLSADGSVSAADGYDPVTALWCCSIPGLRLPLRPSYADAEAALGLLRRTFRTFPFGDAARRWDASLGIEVVDITLPPGRDESAFLVALLTAVCRPSLWLALECLSPRRRCREQEAERVCSFARSARSRLASVPAHSPRAVSDRNSISGLQPN
jgi:hypothetical protein